MTKSIWITLKEINNAMDAMDAHCSMQRKSQRGIQSSNQRSRQENINLIGRLSHIQPILQP